MHKLSPKDLKIIWLSNILALSVPDECYSRNVLFALNLISTMLLQYLKPVQHGILYYRCI